MAENYNYKIMKEVFVGTAKYFCVKCLNKVQ